MCCHVTLAGDNDRRDDDDDRRGGFGGTTTVSLAVEVGIVYIIALVFVLHVDDQYQCINHGRFFIVLALFPAIIGLLLVAVATLTEVHKSWKQWKHRRDMKYVCMYL